VTAGWLDAPLVRMTSDGPAGLKELGYSDPSAIVAGDPQEAAHVFFDRADGKCVVGVWEAQAGTLDYVDYPFDEVCFVIAGRVEITPAGGRIEQFGPGEAFLIRKGFTGRWHMPVALRKFYVECRA
jgi:uncharacterized protein